VYFGLAGTLADLLSGYRSCTGARAALLAAEARLAQKDAAAAAAHRGSST
jgi:hypothetical protein